MNTKNILCYGDSNTWGYIPLTNHSALKSRYSHNERWPGVLQNLLGGDYHVIEEGLNSRTTNLDYAPPPDRNGKTYLSPCLYSHAPLDLVILALGGNDLKTYFNRSPEEIKDGLGELVDIIKSSKYGAALQASPKVLITTPVIPLLFTEKYVDENGIPFLTGAVKKAERLIGLYSKLAKEKGCDYLNLSKEVIPSEIDGVHYDKAAHRRCAEMLRDKINEILK